MPAQAATAQRHGTVADLLGQADGLGGNGRPLTGHFGSLGTPDRQVAAEQHRGQRGRVAQRAWPSAPRRAVPGAARPEGGHERPGQPGQQPRPQRAVGLVQGRQGLFRQPDLDGSTIPLVISRPRPRPASASGEPMRLASSPALAGRRCGRRHVARCQSWPHRLPAAARSAAAESRVVRPGPRRPGHARTARPRLPRPASPSSAGQGGHLHRPGRRLLAAGCRLD